jgi:hypothetical protein
MRFDHGEPPPEFEEEGVEEAPELEIVIEIELGEKPDQVIIEQPPEYGPQDNYLEKELERQRQEELGKMLPKRIP